MKKLILLFSLILAPASVYTEDFKTKLNLSPSNNSHKRFKRAWIWNQLHIMEEINSPLPHHVGKSFNLNKFDTFLINAAVRFLLMYDNQHLSACLVITLLIILRKRHKKELTVLRKSVAEIHEQLVTYDEEGGGEMDTTSYDVSVLNSVRKNGMNLEPGPCLYAQVQKPTGNGNSGTGEMAIMIEVKKDEADNDGDLLPYDTLHIYGYEGAESIAESLSSLESGSSDSDIDYDFLNDWGPRFKMLAELYGLEANQDFVY
ncbi:zinc finger protein 385B [Platysternon megacephalum]|uniref:Zinc finger protein 385B n=1 Tax=Platysternon megacephalum TaxID=55544 RepID=A0A4D9F2A1_9SAUR|nr:zinc finger protein 385B [Platysternon megacephalum]